MDVSPEQFGTGGAIILGALAVLFKRSKAAAKERERTAGERSTEFWTQEFERISERAVRNALITRNEDIRRIVREELERQQR